eukprot:872873_1
MYRWRFLVHNINLDTDVRGLRHISETLKVESNHTLSQPCSTEPIVTTLLSNQMHRVLYRNIAFSGINRLVDLIEENGILNQSDIDELPPRCKPERVLKQFKSKWSEECRRNPDDPSLLRATFSLINTNSRYVLVLLLDCVYWGSLAANIIFMQLILQYLADPTSITQKQAYLCACGMALCIFMIPLTTHFNQYQTAVLCTNIRTALTAIIYEKALKIPNDLYSTSQIINFMSDDIQKFEDFFVNLVECVGSVFLIIALVYFTVVHMVFILVGFGLLLLLIPLFVSTAPIFAKYKAHILSHTDTRLRLIKEALNGYINTKMYAWEPSILQLVQDTRKQEVGYLIKKGRITATNLTMMLISETVVLAVIMLWYFWEYEVLYVSVIYPVLLLYDCLKLGFVYYLPTTLQAYYELHVSMKRLVDFLQTPELFTANHAHEDRISDHPSIRINSVSFYWPQIHLVEKHNRSFKMSKRALSSVNVSFEDNAFVGIIGKVGSGKTALLLSIIGELKADEESHTGDVSITGKIGYCCQSPWIFNGSIKENILFGNEYDVEWYEKVVYACSLDIDFADLPHRDETIIGERGINLSGGQKTRINLARCVYDKPMVLLLDDCLSSVDPVVANHIFVNLLHNETGLMKHTLRLLVTHQINILPQMDQIVIMQNQKIAYMNEYSKLEANEYINIMDITSVDERVCAQESRALLINENDYVVEMKANDCENLRLLANKQSVIDTEESVTGAVPFSCYLALLFPNTRSRWKIVLKCVAFVLLMLSASICSLATNFWLGVWASYPAEQQSNRTYIILYLSLIVLTIAFEFIRIFTIYMTLFAGASALHNKMFRAVLYSSVHFYESNPVGRILNRFSQDQFNMDEKLPGSFAFFVTIIVSFCVAIFLIMLVTPLLYIAIIPLAIIIGIVIQKYLPISRSLKRLEATTKSPIYSYFTVIFAGLSSIRSYRKQTHVLDHAYALIGRHAAVSLSSHASQGWLGFRANIAYSIALTMVCFVSLHLSGTVSPASVGILLFYFFLGSSKLTFVVLKFAEVESYMTSTERVMEYGDLRTEKDEMEIYRNQMIHPPKTWPTRGDIEIKDLSVSYRSYLEPVLNDISVSIKHGERVGIVGRTGSGKTTMFKSLFRLIKPHQNDGYITIDGVNIWDIPLHVLRRALFVIPQNCVLFSATLRYNLDPFNEYTDDVLYQILNEVTLNLDELGIDLDSVTTEYGGNLSVGQTQLICVARALLNYSKNRILLIDEATANIDPHTDEIIQNLFQSKLFKNKTVLTISHRVTNVVNYDKILVMDSGEIKEFDSPQNLLQNEDSIFYKMYNKII